MCNHSLKRVMGIVLASAMMLQTSAPIAYADDNAIVQGDPVLVQENEQPKEQSTVMATSESATPESADQVQPNESSPESSVPISDTTYTVEINLNGGTLPIEWIETANSVYDGLLDSDAQVDVSEQDGTIVATVSGTNVLYLMNPTPPDESKYFSQWACTAGDLNKEENALYFVDGVTDYSLTATYDNVVAESDLVQNARVFTELSEEENSQSEISLFSLRPTDPYNKLDLTIEGLEFVYEDGQIQTFTAPYDGDYIITAYGANGGTGYAKYDGYGVPGRGGMTEATVHLEEGQTIYLYLGEAGGDWSTERTFGGGGGGADAAHAWIGTDDNSLHLFGRGGGATYVSIDEFDMANAGQAPQDFTEEQQAQNDAAAEEAKKHVIMLAAGGGGAGEMGSPYSHYGLNGGGYEGGILRHENKYYLGYEQAGMMTYDATVGGRVLTRDERVSAWIYPATQTRAGYGLHYSINGELYDPNPANKDPIELLYPEREARNWGSFFFGSNAMACTGAGGGGWFGGGTDYAMDGGGGSSYIGTSVITPDGTEVTITDPETVAGANVKYDNTKSSPFYVNGRVLIRLAGETPELEVVLQEAANEEGSRDHIDDNDIYGQAVKLNRGEDVASTTVTYTAVVYYNMGDIMTATPSWTYSTMLNPKRVEWNDGVAKSIDSRLEVNVTNEDLGKLEPGEKYYSEEYAGWYAIKSVMTITNPVNSMYNTENLTKYYFSCSAQAKYSLLSGPKYLNAITEDIGGLTIDYDIFLNHNGVHVYDKRNIINNQDVTSILGTVTATDNHDSSIWQYPELSLVDVNHINTVLVQFSSHNFDTRDSIHYDANLANSYGITGSGNQYSYVFRASTKNAVSTETWEKFLRSITFTTYDAAEFKQDGVEGGVSVFWYADENLWENNMFYDSASSHFYACIQVPTGITWEEARARALSMYNSALDCYGYLAHITSKSEADFVSPFFGTSTGWIGGARRTGTTDWYWVDGPTSETTSPFFRQNNLTDVYNGGTLLWGYANFSAGEPNAGYGGQECYLQYYTSGYWNDLRPSERIFSFIVEWSKDGLTGAHSVSDTDVIGTQVEAVEDYTYTPPSNLSGMVWAENDNDGIYDPQTETPLAGVKVTIEEKTFDDGAASAFTTVTGEHGEYTCTNMQPGLYVITFKIPDGTITQEFEVAKKNAASDDTVANVTNSNYKTDKIEVVTGESTTNVNCGIYIPSSISGYVWDDANRDGVYDDGEQKIEGVAVSLQNNGEAATDGYGNTFETVLTDKNGEYKFENVPSSLSSYEVLITSSDSVYIGNATVSKIPDVSTPKELANTASTISYGDVSAQEKLQEAVIANIYVPSLSGSLEATNHTYKNCALSIRSSVYGYVWGETDFNGVYSIPNSGETPTTDVALAGLKVTLVDTKNNVISTTSTSKSGYYEFSNVEPGKYHIEVSRADGFDAGGKISQDSIGLTPFLPTVKAETTSAQMGNQTTGVYDDDGNLISLESDKFTVSESPVMKSQESDTLGMAIYAGLFIPSDESGLVWEDYNQDGIRDDDEELLTDVSVQLMQFTGSDKTSIDSYTPVSVNGKAVKIQTGQKYNYYTGETSVYEAGKYLFENLPSGTYAVVFSSGDYDMRFYLGSPKDVGDDTKDSDAVSVYTEDEEELVSSSITGIYLPAESELTAYNYNNTYNDFGAYQKLRDVTVTKQIHASEIEWDHGTPTFMITVYGTDQKGVFHEYNHAYEFTQKYVEDNTDENGIVSMTYTFEGIPYARIYNVEEQNTSRFCLEAISGSDNATFEGEVAALDLKYNVSGEVTFLNKVSHYRDTSANSLVTNSLLAG